MEFDGIFFNNFFFPKRISTFSRFHLMKKKLDILTSAKHRKSSQKCSATSEQKHTIHTDRNRFRFHFILRRECTRIALNLEYLS